MDKILGTVSSKTISSSGIYLRVIHAFIELLFIACSTFVINSYSLEVIQLCSELDVT